MRRFYLVLTLLLCVVEIFTQNVTMMNKENYDNEWEKVEQFEQKSLPKSASEAVDDILRKAIADQNSPQIIKALIHQGKYDLILDNENDTLIFHNLKEMIAAAPDTVERAVLHSMLGELYLQYYQKDQRNIDSRTELGDYVPADMKEWTRNIFLDQAISHLNASVAPAEALLKTKVASYSAVVKEGRDSQRFYPTLYDFLVRRAIEQSGQIDGEDEFSRFLVQNGISPESLFVAAEDFVKLPLNPTVKEHALWPLKYYQVFLQSLLTRKMHESVLLTELDKLDFLSRLGDTYESDRLTALQNLLQGWKDDPFSVEIIDKVSDYYSQELSLMNSKDTVQRKEKTAELYDLLKKSIAAFPEYERISLLQNRLTELIQPNFTVTGAAVYSEKGLKEFRVSFRNVQSFKAKLYRISSSVELMEETSKVNGEIASKRTFIKEIPVSLPNMPEYWPGEASFNLGSLDKGVYMLSFDSVPKSDNPVGAEFFFSVSNLAVFARGSSGNRYDFFVVNRITGEPVHGARIDIYKLPRNWENSRLTLEESVETTQLGLAGYEKKIPNHDIFYQAVSGTDNGSQLNRFPSAYYHFSERTAEPTEITDLFTDRSLYRPGQTVYYKAVRILTDDAKQTPVTGKTIEITLRDANQREIAKQALQTNEFGSVAGEFVLPQNLLSGTFSIESAQGRVTFKVEEYKRPSFEVTFDTIRGSYKFGDRVVFKGKAVNFSGVALQQSDVTYRITRQQLLWRFPGANNEHFAEGNVLTNDEGAFEVAFIPDKPISERSFKSVYLFFVEASVTDINGETQTATRTIAVGDVSLLLSIEIPDRLAKESSDKIVIAATNLDGKEIDVTGTCRIYSLLDNDSIRRQELEKSFHIGEQTELKKRLDKLPSGKYRVKLQSTDDRGNLIETEKDFILFSYSDKRPPLKTNDWFVVKNSRFSSATPAEVIFGASEKVHILYEVWQRDSLLDRKWITLTNENRLFSFPYREVCRDGITLMLTFVKDEKFYTHSVNFLPEEKKRDLKIKLDVFRDRLRPGTDEEWRLSVMDPEGQPARAEILASMYDFSLDNLYPAQSWNFSALHGSGYYSGMRLSQDRSFYPIRVNARLSSSWKQVTPFDFDRFNWFGYSLYYFGRIMLRGAKTNAALTYLHQAKAEGSPVAVDDIIAESDIALAGSVDASSSPRPLREQLSTSESSGEVKDASGIRRNFNETAFFFPRLRTDEKGTTRIAFTVPESNTRWRFRVLAHDKQMNTGKAEAFAVSQKELMITPGLPRFLRQGDSVAISTKISNLSGNVINGQVSLEFFNPATEEAIETITLDNPRQPFTLPLDASSVVRWKFEVPEGIDLLGLRIVAKSEQFSDGEQHALVVLPNRMLVTESMRMDVRGGQTKEFTLDRLVNKKSSTLDDYRLTLEFASNPAWYAIQALPVLDEPSDDNAVSWFASYYANSLGAHIGTAYPKVKAMVDAWVKTGGSKSSFLSNLEKNPELRNVLLEETPWVLDAKNEAEQNRKLSLLFDLNRNSNLTFSALRKLQELQTNQGGWSWFKGFSPSVSITQYILYGFSQLNELGAVNPTSDVVAMQQQAVSFIDTEALRRFEWLKKHHREWEKMRSISSTDLEYLYVRSGYKDYTPEERVKELTDFYLSVIEKNWTQYSLYERSLIAVLMWRAGKTEVIRAILDSFREHATQSDEMGMYWPNNQARVFMSQSAVSVHTFIMDAFRMGGAAETEMDEMKRWLLKQKQTQLWETTHATTDAVYALLSSGSDWFEGGGETDIILGAEQIEPDGNELGTGYFKKTWSGAEIKPEMGNVTVQHGGGTPAWGALYWQYFEEADKVGKTDASLDIEKQLFVERTSSSGPQLTQITEKIPLKVGDKVVIRLTVRSDRDLEFVHLKDMRSSAFEPVNQISVVSWQNGISYYQTTKDATTNFYFDVLPRGTYLFEYAVYVTRPGNYSNGIATLQSMYAPEFGSHTSGMRIIVKE